MKDNKQEKPDREYLKNLGFKELPHDTIMNSMVLDLGRRRTLSVGCLGEPNEMVFISEHDHNDQKKITDSVCLHNWDYDGYLTKGKLQNLLSALIKPHPSEQEVPIEGEKKPLSEITEEDAEEVAKNGGWDFSLSEDSKDIGIQHGKHWALKISKQEIIPNAKLYQYLQSKGYKLPVYYPSPQPSEDKREEIKSLQQIKDEVAREYGYKNWIDLYLFKGSEPIIDRVAERYAEQKLTAFKGEVVKELKDRIDLWRINNEDDISRFPYAMADLLKKELLDIIKSLK